MTYSQVIVQSSSCIPTNLIDYGPAISVAISHQRATLAVGYHSGIVQVYDILTGNASKFIMHAYQFHLIHHGPAISVAISHQRATLAVGYHSGIVQVYDILTGNSSKFIMHPY